MTAEQRRSERKPRRLLQVFQDFRIVTSGRVIVGRLVDVSDGGVGVETFIPLMAGSVVTIAGDFQNRDLEMRIRGTARVVHCVSRDDGLFRIGMAFENIACLPPHICDGMPDPFPLPSFVED